VVNRIAARQNLRVELRPSESGGATAAVLIRENLIQDDTPGHDVARPDGQDGGRELAPASALIPQQHG
jgi:hypothetical protein